MGCLSPLPRSGSLNSRLLASVGEVDADEVSAHVSHGLLLGDVLGGLVDEDAEFEFVVDAMDGGRGEGKGLGVVVDGGPGFEEDDWGGGYL